MFFYKEISSFVKLCYNWMNIIYFYCMILFVHFCVLLIFCIFQTLINILRLQKLSQKVFNFIDLCILLHICGVAGQGITGRVTTKHLSTTVNTHLSMWTWRTQLLTKNKVEVNAKPICLPIMWFFFFFFKPGILGPADRWPGSEQR